MTAGGLGRRAVGFALMLAASGAGLVAASEPALALASFTVSPNSGLTGGQLITVSITGFSPGSAIAWCEAAIPSGGWSPSMDYCGAGTTHTGVVSAGGAFGGDWRVERFLYEPAVAGWEDCADPAKRCVILLANGNLALPDALRDIDWAAIPAPPVVRGTVVATPDPQFDGAPVTVTGEGFRPDSRINVFQCGPGATAQSACGLANPANFTSDPTGAFEVSTPVNATVTPPGGTPIDCLTDDPDQRCTIVAAEAVDFPGTYVGVPIEVLPSLPRVVPGSASVAEGDSGDLTVNVPVTLSKVSASTVTAEWTTVFVPDAPSGQADPADDYVPASGTIQFDPGDTATTIPVEVVGDLLDETDEYIVIAVHHPTNAVMGGFWGLGFGGITDDDDATVLPGGATVAEGDAGTTALLIPVTLSNPSAMTVTVEWATIFDPAWSEVAARPASDYEAASGIVTFAPGETAQTIPITVNGDTTTELDELLVVSLRNATNAGIGGFWGLGFGGIVNDD